MGYSKGKNNDRKVHFSKKKYIPELNFPPKNDLKEFEKWLLVNSENNFDHYQLLKMLRDDKFFHLFAYGETGSGKSALLERFAEFMKNEHGKLIIDASGNAFEGAFWARNYDCYLVYPYLWKADKKNENDNVKEKKLNNRNTWDKILTWAVRYDKVVVLMCEDPLESSYLKALVKLLDTLLKRKFIKVKKVCLLREVSFFAYQHGTLKLSNSRWPRMAKRKFLKYVRTGRIRNNQIMCDAQRLGDVDQMVGDNVAIKAIKRTDGHVGNYDKHIQEAIKRLKIHQVVFSVKGRLIAGILENSSFHKESDEKIEEELKVYPKQVELDNYNKLVENRYIDRVAEYYTNKLDRLVLARRRHMQDPENSALCTFEIADLLAIDGKLTLGPGMGLKKPRLVYGEVKFRRPDSKHPRIETNDVKKTIQDLAVKKIHYDLEKETHFWTIDRSMAIQLGWEMKAEALKFPCIVEMISPGGPTKGARSLMDKHHIWNQRVPIDEDTFFS